MRFSDIPGNDNIKRKLIQTVMDQRVSHAQLFFGSDSSPKLALAIAYAQLINCTDKKTTAGGLDSCGVCPSCAKYQKLAHPDLHFIYPVATTKKVTKKPQSKHFIEDWRKFLLDHQFRGGLLDWYDSMGIENKQGIINADDCNEIITILSYKSYESDYKVMIIWMVEKLFHSAAPKLLKILEEPPDKTLFILIASETDQIINTILSRTLMVKIPGMDFILRDSEEEIPLFNHFRDWMRLCYAGKIFELIGFTSELSKTGREKQKNFLSYALRTIGICSGLNYSRPLPAGLTEEEQTFIVKFSPFIPIEKLQHFNALFNDAIFHIERNAHPGTLFLDLSLKIVRVFNPNFVNLP
jgi:DNA polymerase-3 subunit delta'